VRTQNINSGIKNELGSGIRNIYKYLPFYSHGAKPVFLEQIDSFELTIPLAEMEKAPVEAQVEAQ
jgi:predicted HTH transcriptional regulator